MSDKNKVLKKLLRFDLRNFIQKIINISEKKLKILFDLNKRFLQIACFSKKI